MKVIFCIAGNTFSAEFLASWSNLLATCIHQGIEVKLSNEYSSVVHFARSKCLKADVLRGQSQKPFNGEPYDYIMWIDSDMVFKPEDFLCLLQSPHDITCGNYMTHDRVHTTSVREWDEEYFKQNGTFQFMKPMDIVSSTEQYIKVAYSGMGWMLIRYGVIEKMTYPWFHHNVICIGDYMDMCSEDVAFCRNADKCGVHVYIDKNIWIGHYKSFVI
jgi:hypothetical protein